VAPARDRGPLAPIIAQVTGHLRVQRDLQHRLGDPGQQPARPDQRHALGLRPFQQLPGDPHLRSSDCGPVAGADLGVVRWCLGSCVHCVWWRPERMRVGRGIIGQVFVLLLVFLEPT